MNHPVRLAVAGLALLCTLTSFVSAEVKEVKFDDGTLKLKYSVDDSGQKQGQFLENYPTGKTQVKAVYKDNELDGLWTEFTEKGKVRVNARYKAGKLDGLYTEFGEKGE